MTDHHDPIAAPSSLHRSAPTSMAMPIPGLQIARAAYANLRGTVDGKPFELPRLTHSRPWFLGMLDSARGPFKESVALVQSIGPNDACSAGFCKEKSLQFNQTHALLVHVSVIYPRLVVTDKRAYEPEGEIYPRYLNQAVPDSLSRLPHSSLSRFFFVPFVV